MKLYYFLSLIAVYNNQTSTQFLALKQCYNENNTVGTKLGWI